jgi:hypothetical protein
MGSGAVAYNSQEASSTPVRSLESLKRKFSIIYRSSDLTDELKLTELQKLTREFKCQIYERVYRRRPHGNRLVEASSRAAAEAYPTNEGSHRSTRESVGGGWPALLSGDDTAGNTGRGSTSSVESVSGEAQTFVDCDGLEPSVHGCGCVL